MKTKTSELSGKALDWAVEKAQYPEAYECCLELLAYSSDWSIAGPIIEREGITVGMVEKGSDHWCAYKIEHLFDDDYEHEWCKGNTPLIAAMRCYVASKLGASVDVPDDLL